MDNQELTSLVEALLFASGRPVGINTLCEITGSDKNTIKNAVEELKQTYIDNHHGIQLLEINDAYQLATLEKYYDIISKMLDTRPKPSLSQAAFEVLAIIAYNQKVTRAELERIRGVSSDSALNRLIEYDLVEEAGRMDAPGRPMMYKTTDEFLRMFGYKSLKDLPELPKLKEEVAEQMKFEDSIVDENQEKLETDNSTQIDEKEDTENTTNSTDTLIES